MSPARILAVAAVALAWATAIGQASAQCSSSEKRKMKDAGISEVRISALCEQKSSDEDEDAPPPTRQVRPQQQRQRLTNVCQTPVMWCMLGQQGPPGTPCWCASPYGPINGQLIPR